MCWAIVSVMTSIDGYQMGCQAAAAWRWALPPSSFIAGTRHPRPDVAGAAAFQDRARWPAGILHAGALGLTALAAVGAR